MLIASWNVNSIHARLPRLLDWLQRRKPAVVCLQETKTRDDKFPHEALAEVGYHAVCHGQAAYNGVAILVPHGVAMTEVQRGLALPDQGDAPAQARMVAAKVHGIHVVCVYVPNGSALDDPKCDYKKAWYKALRQWLDAHADVGTPLVVAGDFNVAFTAEDMANPERWEKTVLFHPSMRAALAEITAFGLTDLLRKHHPEPGLYTWWDYRNLGFVKNNGVRIDHLLASDALAKASRAAGADRDERKGTRPSDHVPAWAEFVWP